jgi:hypothetical protein
MNKSNLKHKLIMGSVQPEHVKGNIKGYPQIMGSVMRNINNELVAMGFWENAPFEFMNGVIRWGKKDDFRPDYCGKIKRNGALEFSIMEVEFEPLRWASSEEVEKKLREAVVTTVSYIAKK